VDENVQLGILREFCYVRVSTMNKFRTTRKKDWMNVDELYETSGWCKKGDILLRVTVVIG